MDEKDREAIKNHARIEIHWHVQALRRLVATLEKLLDALCNSMTKNWLASDFDEEQHKDE